MICFRRRPGISDQFLQALLLLLLVLTLSVQAATDRKEADDLRYMVIAGDVGEGERDQIRRVVLAMEHTLSDIDAVRTRVEALSWVAAAEVQFNWPDELTINVHPERAIAYWNETAFINKEGVAFKSTFHAGIDLPHLMGLRIKWMR